MMGDAYKIMQTSIHTQVHNQSLPQTLIIDTATPKKGNVDQLSPTTKHQSSNYPNSLTMALTRLTCAKNRIPPHAVAIMKVHYWTQGIPWSRHVGHVGHNFINTI